MRKFHVATSNNGVHAPGSLYYCLFAPLPCECHVRGESHIQRRTNREVATSFSREIAINAARFFAWNATEVDKVRTKNESPFFPIVSEAVVSGPIASELLGRGNEEHIN